MKKLILFSVIAMLTLLSCKKESSIDVTPDLPSVEATVNTHTVEFIEENLPGMWIHDSTIVEGPSINYSIFHGVALPLPVTKTQWCTSGNNINVTGPYSVFIMNYSTMGSDYTWGISFSDKDNFVLVNLITEGEFKGHAIKIVYKRNK